jgi:thymidylate kinase
LCLDEGFGMMAVSILWRKPSDWFSLKEYLRHVPTPEVLVYLRAPPETCLDRQRERGRMGISEPWTGEDVEAEQIRFAELCEEVVDQQRSNTTVLTVDNSGSVEDTVNRLGRSLVDALSVDGSAFVRSHRGR